jgi:hypothetical protein
VSVPNVNNPVKLLSGSPFQNFNLFTQPFKQQQKSLRISHTSDWADGPLKEPTEERSDSGQAMGRGPGRIEEDHRELGGGGGRK